MNLRWRQIGNLAECSQAEQDAAIVNYSELIGPDAVDNYYCVLEQWNDFKQDWELVRLHVEEKPKCA